MKEEQITLAPPPDHPPHGRRNPLPANTPKIPSEPPAPPAPEPDAEPK